MTRNCLLIFWGLIGCGLYSQTTIACNIPVFRYALERWEPDDIQIIVFHDQALTTEHQKPLTDLTSTQANLNLLAQSINDDLDSDLEELLTEVTSNSKLDQPVAIVRSRIGRGQTFKIWSGPIEELPTIGLIDSPKRKELSKRLLTGDSAVWIVLKSNDEKKSQAVIDLLNESLPKIASQIPFPEGIGLPGSELFSPIPLDMRFSVLEIEADDPEEKFLINWLTSLRKDSYEDDEPLIMPVFGRGRALEVMPASALNPSLLQQLCVFLCGACSCQVKDLNPGFDLLISADWQSELFGDEIPDIPESEPRQLAENEEPQYVPIPTGIVSNDEEVADDETVAETETAASKSEQSVQLAKPSVISENSQWLVLGFVGLVVVVTGLSVLKV